MTTEADDAQARPRPRRLRLPGGVRGRILAAFLLLLGTSEVVALIVEREVLLARAGERVDRALTQEVEEFRRLVRLGRNPNTGAPFGSNVRAIFDVFLSRNVPGEGERVYTFLDGAPYRSTRSLPPSAWREELPDDIGATAQTRRGSGGGRSGLRYIAVPVEVQGRRRGVFVVTGDLAREEAEIADTIRITAGVSLLVLVMAAGLAWVLAGRVLAPLRTLTDTARSLTESDLTRRIPVKGEDEIAELAATFNAMLKRLEHAFDSQRAFVSDAGHELRTPITIVRGHLELLGDDPAERRETIALVTDELDRMSRFVDDLLTLARSERPDFLQLEDLDLDVLTEELMEKARALGDRDWSLDSMGTGRIAGDRQRLTQAVMNLAQNAVQHTLPGDPIALGSELAEDRARLWVRDRGPGIPLADHERIFDRFARAPGRRSDGAGLGLSIVRAIAEAHGGRVTVASRVGAGATFTVEIPCEPITEVEAP